MLTRAPSCSLYSYNKAMERKSAHIQPHLNAAKEGLLIYFKIAENEGERMRQKSMLIRNP